LSLDSQEVKMSVPRQMPDTATTAVMTSTTSSVDTGIKVFTVAMFTLQYYFAVTFKKILGTLLSL
jgi:hypothetical protein